MFLKRSSHRTIVNLTDWPEEVVGTGCSPIAPNPPASLCS